MSYGGQQNRTEWYDRAPLMVAASFQAGAAPHGGTTRWTYTVPASRKALVESALASVSRAAAASTVQQVLCYVRGASPLPYLSFVEMYNLGQGAAYQSNLAGAIVLLAGYTITCTTSDVSPDGVVAYCSAFKGTEYDA